MCAGVVVVFGLEGQQVLVAHLGGLQRSPQYTLAGRGTGMGPLNGGKHTLNSGLGIFEVCSLCRVSGCAFLFAQFVLFPGTFREPAGQHPSSRGMPVEHGRTKSD